MGKTIQVRDVPEEIHAELRSRAAAAGTSLSDYLLEELQRVAPVSYTHLTLPTIYSV